MEHILYSRNSFPLRAEWTLERPRVHELLRNAVEKPLAIVVGGAGYGKTQAVLAFLESTDRNVVWLQLSWLDNDISRLWERIVHGLRPHDEAFAKALERLGYPETVSAFNKFLRLLAKAMERIRPFTIVLDDFHNIQDATVITFIETLAAACVDGHSVILISRRNPGLNISGLSSQNQFALVSEDDLRFTLKETETYFERFLGLPLSHQDLLDIHTKTEGWILAIHLIELSIKKRGVYTRTRELFVDIFELIQREIYAVASPALQHFLLKLALLDDIPRELFDELSLQDGDIRQELLEKNLLLRYDAYSDSYYIHPLLKDFLLERKSQLTQQQIADVHRATARWFEKSDRKLQAISLYASYGEYDKAFDIILSMERTISKNTIDFLLKMIESAPIDQQEKPVVQLLKTLYLFINNKVDKAHELLSALRGFYEGTPDTDENRAVLGEIYIQLALISIVRQNDEFTTLFPMADVCLPHGSTLIDQRMNVAEGINITGIKHPRAGELEKKRAQMMDVMPIAARVMNGCLFGAEYLNAADSCYMQGDIQGAERSAYDAILRARQKGQHGIECMANFLLVRIHVMNGDFARIKAMFALMENDLHTPGGSSSLVLYDIMRGWACVKIGAFDEVPAWILSDDLSLEMLSPVIVGREYLVRSDAMLAKGQYNQLLVFMEYTDAIYKQRGILYAVIQNEITRAIVHHCLGNRLESIRALNSAYALSSPNHLIIQYVEYGNQMRAVIGAARRSDQCVIPKEWLNAIYTKSEDYAKQLLRVANARKKVSTLAPKSTVSLSKREKELITCLSTGLKRSEMADQFGISINTVKSILQSAYSKLGAANGADAVRIASGLGIIDRVPSHGK